MTSSLKSSTLPPLLGSYCAARFAAQRCTISLSTFLLLINPYHTNMCKYAIMQIGKCANMQICKLAYMQICNIMQVGKYSNMTQLLLLGKVEYGGGPIFKVVLEC